MRNNVDYIGYKEAKIGFGEATLATGGAAAPFTLALDAAVALIAVAPALSSWVQGWWARPAHNTRGFLSQLYPMLVNREPNERLAMIIASEPKMQAKDVVAIELFKWYRTTYPEDYKKLTVEAKNYWNSFLDQFAVKYKGQNNAYSDALSAKFTIDQVNYAAPVAATILDTILPAGTSTKNKYIIYGAIAVGLYLLFKK